MKNQLLGTWSKKVKINKLILDLLEEDAKFELGIGKVFYKIFVTFNNSKTFRIL